MPSRAANSRSLGTTLLWPAMLSTRTEQRPIRDRSSPGWRLPPSALTVQNPRSPSRSTPKPLLAPDAAPFLVRLQFAPHRPRLPRQRDILLTLHRRLPAVTLRTKRIFR